MSSVVQRVRFSVAHRGVHHTLYDLFVRAVNRLIVFKTLHILKIGSVPPSRHNLPPDYQARFLRTEIEQLVTEPDLDVTESFVASALDDQTACLGVFRGPVLASFSWYATEPTATSEHLVIELPPSQIYLFKAFTRQPHRGQKLLAAGVAEALEQYLARGYSGLVCYVESNNYRSLRAFAHLGAQRIGRVWLVELGRISLLFSSRAVRRANIRISRHQAQSPRACDAQASSSACG